MIEEVEGIVAYEKDYSETSKILDIITLEHGLISVISKGCKTSKSPLRSASNKLIYGKFHIYYKPGKLSTLKSVDIISHFKNICMDLKKISYAALLLELATQVLNQNNNKDIYTILISALNKIDEGFNPMIITDIAGLKYLEYLGVTPVLDSCVKCGSTKNIKTLSSDLGGYVCSNCYTNEIIVSEKTIKLIRMLYYVDISKISDVNVSKDVMVEIHDFVDRYYDKYTGLYFKSKKFLKVSDDFERI